MSRLTKIALTVGLLIAGLAFLYGSPAMPIPMILMILDRSAWVKIGQIHLLILGLILVAIVRKSRWSGGSEKLLYSYTLLTTLIATICLTHPLIMTRFFTNYGYMQATRHPIIGHYGWPNGIFWHWSPEFDVVYHYDRAGWRQTLIPPDSHQSVVFLGCSFTFGHGVHDTEVFASRLAREYWPRTLVENLATSGWGTFEAWYVLRDRLGEGGNELPKLEFMSKSTPDDVFYCWIPDHFRRYGGAEALGLRGRVPTFQRGADQLLQFTGFKESQALGRDQVDPSLQLVVDMNERCRRAGSRFHFVAFNSPKPQDGEEEFISATREHGIDVVDLRGESSDFYPVDGHPRPSWHAAIARAIARRFPAHAPEPKPSKTSPKGGSVRSPRETSVGRVRGLD